MIDHPERRSEAMMRRYVLSAGTAEPVALFGRLARAGIRLRCRGPVLEAAVPASAMSLGSWPALDRLVARHAASLAVTASLAERFAEGRSPRRVSALLAELRRDVPRILLETVGGEERLADLIARVPLDADFDLACVACCRGLAIRAIHQGHSLIGLLADGEGDEEERRHGPGYRADRSAEFNRYRRRADARARVGDRQPASVDASARTTPGSVELSMAVRNRA